ncbi:MAG: rod shape-determining protein MreC [Actinomycetota bacterium]|nr:rod shape-determining protein MreC [Actinomycetota bacterium]
MPDRRRSRTLLAVLLLVALVLLTVDYRQGDEGSVAVLQRGALAVFGPVQEGFATVVRPVGDLLRSVGELGGLREQNRQLQADIERLRREQLSLADLRRQNEELRVLLGMRQRLDFDETTAAQVIARPPGSFEWTVLLDAGADQGLREGQPVINADGLVGKVTEVTSSNARVQLLSSPSASYVVRVAETGEDGLLRGRGTDPFQLEIIDPQVTVQPGAKVVTRAFQGTAIPDGIPVGVVQEPSAPQPRGTRFLSVRPYVDFNQLNFVAVVLDPPVQPAALDGDERVRDGPRPPRAAVPVPAEPGRDAERPEVSAP